MIKMKIDEFLRILKDSRPTFYSETNLRCRVNPERTKYEIAEPIKEKICRCCGTDLSKQPNSIIVLFNKRQDYLTIFQASLLFMLSKKKIPYDYARYHKSKAGMEFIRNIKAFYVSGGQNEEETAR